MGCGFYGQIYGELVGYQRLDAPDQSNAFAGFSSGIFTFRITVWTRQPGKELSKDWHQSNVPYQEQTITVYNAGNQATGDLDVSLAVTQADNGYFPFTVDPEWIPSIPPGQSSTFKLRVQFIKENRHIIGYPKGGTKDDPFSHFTGRVTVSGYGGVTRRLFKASIGYDFTAEFMPWSEYKNYVKQ